MTDKNKLTKKATWTKTEIVDLPYKPFDSEDKTERNVLNQVVNGIYRVAKSEQRKGKHYKYDADYNFEKSECIIGIDISNIAEEGASYLDTLFLVSRLYPFLLFNCSISIASLRNLHGIHNNFRDVGFILPVIGQIAANDVLFASNRYGKEIFQLISGEIDEIPMKTLFNEDSSFRLNDILNRFEGLFLDNKLIKYAPKIEWLGVDSKELSSGLTDLYINNVERFDKKEFCLKHSIDEELFVKYLNASMLFGLNDDGSLQFRFLRKNIIISLMRSLVDQYDREMINRNVINITYKDSSKFKKQFIEYHKTGLIYDLKDTFAIKILSNLRHSCEKDAINTVILVDNGTEKALWDMLPSILGDDKEYLRIMNYNGAPIVYPFDNIPKKGDALIVTDIVNTGSFINEMLSTLKDLFKINVVSIFSLIINNSLKTRDIIPLNLSGQEIRLNYYVEKRLHNVTEVIAVDKKRQFANSGEGAYLNYWYLMNEHGDIKIEHVTGSATVAKQFGSPANVRSYHSHHIGFSSQVNRYSHFIGFLLMLHSELEFTAIAYRDGTLDDSTIASFFSAIETIEMIAIHKDKIHASDKEKLRKHKSILIYSTAINIGQDTLSICQYIHRTVAPEVKISVMALLSRKNVVESTQSISDEYLKELKEFNIQIHCYYDSNLPYYLTTIDSPEYEYFKKHIKVIAQ